jgi:hypothetical protein
MLTVTGTSNGTTGDMVDIDCWYDDGNSRTFATGVTVQADGSFSVTAPLARLGGYPCRLRAEDTSVSSSELPQFTGPRIAVSEFSSQVPDFLGSGDLITGGPNAGLPHDYYANGSTFLSYVAWNSAGNCGVEGQTIDSTLAESNFALSCMGSLNRDDGVSRSEIQVDGSNAYNPNSAYDLFGRTGPCPTTCNGSRDNSGFPSLTVSQNWNSSNGFESTQETDGIVKCAGADGELPPNEAACPSFAPTGVQLQRSISMIGPYQILMTDTWSSTDGHAHTVDTEYDDTSESPGSGAGFEFPGESSFSRHGVGDVVAGAPSAPGSIYVHDDVSAPDGNPDENYAAITFSTAPSGFLFSGVNEFSEHQILAVPAAGSATLSYIYSFGTTIEGVQALALAAQDRLHSPAIAITSPANNTKVTQTTVSVSGTASAGSGIASLTVAGHPVSVASNGAWTTSVALAKGTNTITATATSNSGQTASAQITVIYAKSCTVPHVKGLSVSKAEKKIKAAGCLIGKIKKKHSKVKKGRVAASKPGAGRKVKAGTKVTLFVSKGP